MVFLAFYDKKLCSKKVNQSETTELQVKWAQIRLTWLCGRGFVYFMYCKSSALTLFRNENKLFLAAIISNCYSSLKMCEKLKESESMLCNILKDGLAAGFKFETKWISRICKIFHLLCSLGTKSLLVLLYFHFWSKCATFIT